MNEGYEVIATPSYKKDIKTYKKKKYLKINKDLSNIYNSLIKGELVGDKIPKLKLETDTDIYKARAKNSSIRVGKSNGFRLIYAVLEEERKIYLLSVYSKKDKADISRAEIIKLVNTFC